MTALWIATHVLCVALGVLLSKRALFSMTDAYAEMWHAERAAKDETRRLQAKYDELVGKLKDKAGQGGRPR